MKGLGRQEAELLEVLHFQLVALDGGEDGVAALEHFLRGQDSVQLRGLALLDLDFFFDARDGFFDGLQVCEDQLGIDSLHVRARIHLAVNMDYVGVIEDAHHLGDGFRFPDIGQELVPEAFALAGTLDDAGDVHKGHSCRQEALGAEELGELLEPRIRQADNAHVGLDGGERVVRCQHLIAGQCVEEG
jgi:hypothetical protein